LNAFFITIVVTIIAFAASAGAGIYSWAGWYQPEPPKELKK